MKSLAPLVSMWNIFRVPSANELAMRELEEARRELLRSYSLQEYATAMVQYNSDRVARLEQHVSLRG